MSRHVIEAEQAPQAEPWTPPAVGGPEAVAEAREASPQLPTVEEIEAIQRAAHEEGYQAGYEEGHREGLEVGRREGYAQGLEEGRTQGLAELRVQGEELSRLLDTLEAPFQALDEQVTEELAQLAMIVARHLVRRELKTDPGVVVSVVREAVGLLPAAARDIRVILHPEDAALVRRALAVEEGEESRWRIVEEPTLTRGGCRIESRDSRIDATVETRLGALITQALGGEREDDSTGSHPEPSEDDPQTAEGEHAP